MFGQVENAFDNNGGQVLGSVENAFDNNGG